MPAAVLKQGSGKELRKLLAMLAGSIGETLSSLIGKELLIKPVSTEITDAETVLDTLQRPNAVVRGALDKDFNGRFLLTMIEAADATAMAGLMMMTPEHVIETRRANGVLEGDDAEAFGELGNVMCSGMDGVLRAQLPNAGVRLQDHLQVKPGLDEGAVLPEGRLVACVFKLRVASYPESEGRIILDLATAEAWNKAPLETAGDAGPAASASEAKGDAAGPKLPEEDSLEDIPAAPIRGVMNTYLTAVEIHKLARRSARRVGLELRRFSRAEVPNPSAHRGEIVLMDVPAGDERRFEWCRRLKEYNTGVRVVLLVHHPSRLRVVAAFQSLADVILGWPVEEQYLSGKLAALVPATTEAE